MSLQSLFSRFLALSSFLPFASQSSPVEQGNYRRILAVGDIHGSFLGFCRIWEDIGFRPDEDLLIFLGDYIDRGRQSWPMMEWVMNHRGEKGILFLRGNHEQMMWHAFRGKDGQEKACAMWLENGGLSTIASLRSANANGEINRWLDFIEQMPLWHEVRQDGREFVFCHAGINPRQPMDKQSADTLLWDRSFVQRATYRGRKTVIVGHTPVQFSKALDYEDAIHPLFLSDGHIIMADTGSYLSNGHVSCVNVLDGTVFESNR